MPDNDDAPPLRPDQIELELCLAPAEVAGMKGTIVLNREALAAFLEEAARLLREVPAIDGVRLQLTAPNALDSFYRIRDGIRGKWLDDTRVR